MLALSKSAAAIAFAAIIATPAFAAGPTPVGKWELSTGEARFEVVECGAAKICATLTWLREDARTAENLPYLNQRVINGAIQTTPAKWKGSVDYKGETFTGTMTMLSGNQMKLGGCKAIACESLTFNRI